MVVPVSGPESLTRRVNPGDEDGIDETLTRSGSGASMTDNPRSDSGLDTVASDRANAAPALQPGERIGAFEIVRPIGAGGMGQVFAARRIELSPGSHAGAGIGEIVALKYLERTSANLLYRFKQEFRTLAGVTHENLVALGELVVLEDLQSFFTMELVDGIPFDEYVRGKSAAGELPNLARLRRAFKQLVAGVRHLHRHGCIHRDLKPSNVLVTPEGRVVILDFGLVRDHSRDGDQPEQQIMGTPAYMSPEQAGLERTGPPADWYGVGVMLFECLTGSRPFRGTITHLLYAKREYDPPAILELVPKAPVDLAQLCQGLIARRPEDRPSGGEIAAALDGVAHDESAGPDVGSFELRRPFIARQSELAILRSAFDSVVDASADAPQSITVHVRGRSGYGKSSLVREFLAGARERSETIVLSGRCLERESVPYKGLDPVIDALSVVLHQLPRAALDTLVPEHPTALVRLFPVLDEVWSVEQLRAHGRSLGPVGGLDAHELRQRAFASLRGLLAALACRSPLIIHIDDFQWGNLDSARLLTELVRPPDPPAMLVVVSYRDEVDGNESLEALTAAEAVAERDVREVVVGPLGHAEARTLALVLMGEGSDPALAEAYAAGAEGSPFYVGQMVRGATLEGASPGQLDQLVVRRILQLDPASRKLLEVVAVAGRPIDSEAAFAALDLPDAERLVPALRAADLLRVGLSSGPGTLSVTLETTHDRIREVTVGELDPAELRATHLRVALALERSGSDHEALAEQFERGGDRARAAEYYQRAAEQAGNSLAFARALALYRTTLELVPEDADPNWVAEVRRGLAEQLINVGRGHEAAQLLLGLAHWYEAPERGELVRAREFRREAADQLIKTGHVEDGLSELDRLLRSVGLQLPVGKAAAVTGLVWEQTRLKLRGFGFERRPAAEVPRELLDQIDMCFAVVNGLSTQETLLSALFHYRNLRLSLTAGEPLRVARALAYQCIIDVAGGDWRMVESHFTTARALAADDPKLLGFIDLCDAAVHWFERRFLQSSVRHTKVIERLESVAGSAWDRRTAQLQSMWTLLCQGRLSEFWDRAKGVRERASERGDMQELVEVSSFEAIALVLAGKPEESRRILATAQHHWNPGRYLFGDVWACFAWVDIHIHEGEPEAGVARSKEALAQMKRTFLDQSATARRNAQEHLCRALVGTAVLRDDPSYAKLAKKLAAKLRSERNDVLTAHMALVDAALASMTGDRQAALGFWSESAVLFEAHGIVGHVAAIDARKAAVLRVLGMGPEAERLAARATAYFEREGIDDVDGFCRVLAPANMTRLQ